MEMSAFIASGDILVMKHLIACSVSWLAFLTGTVSFGLPVIISPIQGTTNRVSLGSRLVLSVQALSAVSAVTYQWRFGSTNIAEATNSTLVLDSIGASQ